MTDQTPIQTNRAQLFEMLRTAETQETASMTVAAPVALPPNYLDDRTADEMIRRAMFSFRPPACAMDVSDQRQPRNAQKATRPIQNRFSPS